jgi:hypothetical protein
MTTKADVDMSPKAVSGRIEMIRALYKLCMALKQANVIEARPVEPQPKLKLD